MTDEEINPIPTHKASIHLAQAGVNDIGPRGVTRTLNQMIKKQPDLESRGLYQH